jgi:SAM-dependent methyltransferase
LCARCLLGRSSQRIELMALEENVREERNIMERNCHQESVGLRRRVHSFIVPLIEQLYTESRFIRILDDGTGTGSLLDELAELSVPSLELWGIDPTVRGGGWHSLPNFQALHLSIADGLHLPFPEGIFDLVISLGVFEHVGCTGPTLVTPKPTLHEERMQFAREILRVLKLGGYALVTCPNRYFPMDFWHSPNRYGFRVHTPWDRWMPSFYDAKDSFTSSGLATIRHLPQLGYYTFTLAFAHGYPRFAMRLFEKYLEISGRSAILSTYLQPFLVLLVKKECE